MSDCVWNPSITLTCTWSSKCTLHTHHLHECLNSDASNACDALSSAIFQFSIVFFQNDSQQLSYAICFAIAFVSTMATNVDIKNVQNNFFF